MENPSDNRQSLTIPQAIRAGWGEVMAASPRIKALVALLFLLLLAMLPFGRTGDDAGGILAPLTVDSGVQFRTRPGADFFSVYDAGARAVRGIDPYSVNADTGGEGFRAPYVATFRYLPITVYWLAAPLNVLPPWWSFGAWCVFNIALIVANFLLCVGRRPGLLWLFALVWMGWFPLIAELHMGQFSLFMGTLLLWGWDAFARGEALGGAGWLLATLIKVYPVCMAPSLWFWGRRWLVGMSALFIVLTTLSFPMLYPDSMLVEGMGKRGVEGRLVGGVRQPYAGAQGPQELMNAIVWKLQGRGFGEKLDDKPTPLRDPVFWLNALQLAAFASLCAWALWKTRRELSLAAVGLFWMSWFFAYKDAWEHHYMLFQCLLGLLLARGVIDWRAGLLCYVCAGGPSLWWLWQRSGYTGGFVPETIGLLYFLQRPIAVYFLTVLLVLKIKESAE